MLIAARNAMMAGGGWKNPYVTDGLIAMWDGEWNAGGGVHDPNATVWKDLSGNGYDLTFFSTSTLGSNYVISSGTKAVAQGEYGVRIWNCKTRESVFGNTKQGFCPTIICATGNSPPSPLTRANDGLYVNKGRQLYNISSGRWNGETAYIYNQGNSTTVSASLTYEGASLGECTQAFSNGQSIISTAGTRRLVAGGGDAVYNGICVGGISESNSAFFFLDKIYCIRLYSRALTAAEVAANYAVDKARFNLP